MKHPFFRIYSILGLFSFLSINCNQKEIENRQKINNDSLILVKAKADSLKKEFFKNLAKCEPKKIVKIDDKTINVIAGPKLSKEIHYQLESDSYSDYYLKEIAKRDEILLSFRIKFSSKSRSYGSGNFFPAINLFRVHYDDSFAKVGELKWSLYREGDKRYRYLEQIFDYKESEVFVCWTAITVPFEEKYVVAVNKEGSDSLKLSNVIGIINPSQKK